MRNQQIKFDFVKQYFRWKLRVYEKLETFLLLIFSIFSLFFMKSSLNMFGFDKVKSRFRLETFFLTQVNQTLKS